MINKCRQHYIFIIKIGILILNLLIGAGCSGLMYYPTSEKYFSAEKFKVKKEDVYFQDEAGNRLHGWWVSAVSNEVAGTIVYFHGNAENLTSHFIQLSWIPEFGYNYFIFDYPGYGESTGSPSPESCLKSGMAALKWVHANKDARPLVVMGQSMGGIIALRTVQELRGQVPLKGFVAESTFPSFQKISKKKLSLSMITWLLQPLAYVLISDEWAPKNLQEWSLPTLVTHGQKDQVVEPEFGEQIFEAIQEPKTIWRIPEGRHVDIFWAHNGIYRQRFLDWMANLK